MWASYDYPSLFFNLQHILINEFTSALYQTFSYIANQVSPGYKCACTQPNSCIFFPHWLGHACPKPPLSNQSTAFLGIQILVLYLVGRDLCTPVRKEARHYEVRRFKKKTNNGPLHLRRNLSSSATFAASCISA